MYLLRPLRFARARAPSSQRRRDTGSKTLLVVNTAIESRVLLLWLQRDKRKAKKRAFEADQGVKKWGSPVEAVWKLDEGGRSRGPAGEGVVVGRADGGAQAEMNFACMGRPALRKKGNNLSLGRAPATPGLGARSSYDHR